MGIHFSYTNPVDDKEHTFDLRVSPYNVNWTYNINTATYDTYGGQVIQVLSVNVDALTIDGQFGREGPFGVKKNKTKHHVQDLRWGGSVPPGGWVTNDLDEQWQYEAWTETDNNRKIYHAAPPFPGLYQMSEFFTDYFSVSAQGGDKNDPGKFIQIPMKIVYDTGPYPDLASAAGPDKQTSVRHWEAFPNSFPAFSRSNEEFAPLWKIEFSVYQADPNVEFATKNSAIKALSRIRDGIGWEIENPWIDPAANPKDPPALVTKRLVSQFKHFLPKITEGDLSTMIWQGISMPALESGIPMNTVFNQFGDIGSKNPLTPKQKHPPGKK